MSCVLLLVVGQSCLKTRLRSKSLWTGAEWRLPVLRLVLVWVLIRIRKLLSYYHRWNIDKYPLFIVFQSEIRANSNAFPFWRDADNRRVSKTALLKEVR